ncbi:MAG: dTDP-glucose 4,6-dehydratase [Gammaproteobacteria bacterium CG11_big_fil_rev_8_21_14_0_20_46_22]|nr:MAG: dTDP-glucose 4,6-dehydratase [Gammaproteobacteria bacterium CG12_big_fil_rev_8_21_14_0_65_46_12]PIR11283.1 MAG: dTDP-glucose 4,6-dehydratase [Gammaproteobacteria bacterium CG11_big_fil_rev_8_21_14_0_20_46_22]
MYTGKRYLVTGGAGFIGSHFVRLLLSKPSVECVVNVDALTYAGSLENVADCAADDRYHFSHTDICDGKAIASLLREHGIDTLVHFAAESHVDRSISGPAAFIQTNLVGTFSLLEEARLFWLGEKKWDEARCRFHHISTDEVYGTLKKDEPAFTEVHRYEPNSPYSASKAGSDHLVRAYQHTYGLPVTTSNCSNNYGSYQHAEKLIPTIIRSCAKGEPIPVYGDGSNIRDWLHVKDHCEAIDTIIQTAQVGSVYNIGSDNEQNNLAIVKMICAIMDELRPEGAPHERLISFVQDRAGHDWRYAINGEKIERELAWKANIRFEAGLRETVEFYLERV